MTPSKAKQIALDQVKNRWSRTLEMCCHCEQRISTTFLGNFENVPLEGGFHTEFLLLRCLECDKAVGFPKRTLG